MPECPSVAELVAAVKSLTNANGDFQTAWSDSFIDPFHCCEQGGFIYVDFPIPARITRVFITKATKGSTMNQRTTGPNAAIDLNSPGIGTQNVILVANFHTHPLSNQVQGDPQPSRADINNSFARQLPGIVISRAGVYTYGPQRRTNLNNPKGYPTSSGEIPGFPPAPALLRGPLPPTTVPKQWPEGTGNFAFRSEVRGKIENGDSGDLGDVVYVEWSDEDVVHWEPLKDCGE